MAKNTLIVIGNIEPSHLVPTAAKAAIDDLNRASRLYETYCITFTELDPDVARSRLVDLGHPCAVGPEEVWRKFPDLRGDFSANVQRVGFNGALTISTRLAETIAGDQMVADTLVFSPQALRHDNEVIPPISVDPNELNDVAPGLRSRSMEGKRDLTGCWIYVLDYFSIDQINSEVVPGIDYLSARELMQNTNFVELWNKNTNHAFSRPENYSLPSRFTGAFVFRPQLSHNTKYWDALISRVIAAAAATTSVSGKVILQVFLSDGELRYHQRSFESWSMPFRPWPVREQWTLAGSDVQFWRAMQVISSSDEVKFASAKEDYRALSLETIADSRHTPALAMRYTQIWMAIERLLPFRHETTMQLAVSLPALVASTERSEEFDRLRSLYDLRSKIAHGYAFKRNEEIYGDISYIAQIFRRLFILSLSHDNDEALRKALLSHVLTGQPDPIDR